MRIENVAKELKENRQKIKRLLNKVEKEEKKWNELRQWILNHPNIEINCYEILNKIDNLEENK